MFLQFNVDRYCLPGNTVVQINGTGFGGRIYDTGALTIGDKPVTVVSYTGTEILAKLPPMATGTYDLRLQISADEFADMR